MKFLQLTDIHLTTPGETIAGRDPNANFQKALDHCLVSHSDAEAMIITGDLSDWGDVDDYERLKEAIGKLPFPVHLCIGNHDNRDHFAHVFPERLDDNGFVQSVIELGDHLGITLDTKISGTHAGELCLKRLDWFEEKLSEAAKPVFVFLHHNPVPTGSRPIDSIMLQNSDRFAALVERYTSKIRHIFFGHCHMPLSGSLHGVPFSAPRGTNHAGWINYDETELLSGSNLPEAYAVVLAEEASVMIGMMEYGYNGPIRNENSPNYETWDRETMER